MKRFLIAAAVLASLPVFAGTLILTGASAPVPASAAAVKAEALYGANTPMGAMPPGTVPTAPAPTKAATAWEVRSDDLNFANVFTRWGREAGYAVRWDARKNAVVEGPDRIGGSFEDAVTYVLSGPGISTSAYPLEVCFYPNTPPLARVTRKGEQDKECK